MLILINILWKVTEEVSRDYHHEPTANIRCGKVYHLSWWNNQIGMIVASE